MSSVSVSPETVPEGVGQVSVTSVVAMSAVPITMEGVPLFAPDQRRIGLMASGPVGHLKNPRLLFSN